MNKLCILVTCMLVLAAAGLRTAYAGGAQNNSEGSVNAEMYGLLAEYLELQQQVVAEEDFTCSFYTTEGILIGTVSGAESEKAEWLAVQDENTLLFQDGGAAIYLVD